MFETFQYSEKLESDCLGRNKKDGKLEIRRKACMHGGGRHSERIEGVS